MQGYPFTSNFLFKKKVESDLLKDFELCLKILVNPQDRFHLNILRNRWKVRPDLDN